MATTTYGTPYVSGTDLVANWPAASLTVANSIDSAGYYIGRGINAQVASYTAVLTDAGKTITMTAAGANTVTIPANASVAFVVGTQINILNLGAGACTPTAGAGVTINGTITALATNETATLIKTATNTWSYLVAATPAAPGLSLVTPTSVAGTGVTVSGGQVTFTAASTISLNGVFTSTYDNYQIVISAVGSASLGLRSRMRLAGTDNTSATAYTLQGYTSTSSLTNKQDTGADLWEFGNVHTVAFSNAGTFFSPFLAEPTQFIGAAQRRTTISDMVGLALVHSASTSFDGVTFFTSSGTVTGKLRVYGLRNS